MRAIQTASHWGIYDVMADDKGDLVATLPHARDAHPSPLIQGLPDIVRDKLRIDQPYVREGFLRHRGAARTGRGGDRFVAVSWPQAMGLIKEELQRVKAEHGNEAIYGGSYGWASAGRLHHAPSVLKRFLGLHGGYVDKLGNHSFGAAMHIAPYVIGRGDIPNLQTPWPVMVEHTRLLVLFGGAHLKNAQIHPGGHPRHDLPDWFERARQAGMEIINISPSRDDVGSHLTTQWLPIRPNTDAALMLALAHTLASENLHDRAFLDRYCEGYQRFEDYLLGRSDGQPKDAAWAARITEIEAETIRALARKMAATRTLVATSWSIQRADHGEQPVWATIALASMLGQIGLLGGGFSFGLAATGGFGLPMPANLPRPTLGLGPNAVKTHVPVGRIADLLLRPGEELQYNGRTIVLPDIRLVYSVGGNPFHHNTNLNRFVEAWRRPETVIVHEPWWGPAAKFADIVLPATTTLERNDIQAAEGSRFYMAMRQAIAPVGQARNDFDIFAELADEMGFGNDYHFGRDEMGWLRHMYDEAAERAGGLGYNLPDFDHFWAEGVYEFPEPAQSAALLHAFRDDPDSHRLATPSGRIELYSQTIAGFNYDDCPPHPTWLEPSEWLGGNSARYPIHLLSNQPSVRLHSQLDPAPISRAAKIKGREPLRMNGADAAARGLRAGDLVRVYNDRGACIAAVEISEALRPGVAQIATGAWYDPEKPDACGSLDKHGNANVLTHDRGTSRLGQSSAAQTVLVEIERCDVAPEPSAFELPERVTQAI